MYKFYLNDTLLTNPVDGWLDFTMKINRDFSLRRMVVSYPTDLIFTGDGFNILFDAIEQNGYDTVFDFRAEKESQSQGGNNSILGLIYLIDVEFDLTRRTATTQVKENGFIARVWGNMSNPVVLPSLSTKNGLDMFSSSRRNISFDETTSDPIAHEGIRKGVDVYRAFQDIITNVTDGNVSLESNFLSNTLGWELNNPTNAHCAIIRGRELRLGTDRDSEFDYQVKINMTDLFSIMANMYNLYMYQDTTSEGQVLRIEGESDFYPLDSSVDIESPENMTMSYFQELFYSTVRLGASNARFEDGNTAHNLPQVPFITFKSDDYYVDGNSNIDRKKDISTNQLIIDSNVIRDVLINDVDTYDDNLFLIQYKPSIVDDQYVAVTTQLFGSQIFNRGLMSDEVARRHQVFGKISNNITSVTFDNRFKYKSTSEDERFIGGFADQYKHETFDPIFSDRVSDRSEGNFNETSSKYTAQFNGDYTFEVGVATSVEQIVTQTSFYTVATGTVWTQTYDTAKVTAEIVIMDGVIEKQVVPVFSRKYLTAGVHFDSEFATIQMEVNEVAFVRVTYNLYNNPPNLGSDSYVENPNKTLLHDMTIEYSRTSFFSATATPILNLSFDSTDDDNAYKGTRINLAHFLTQAQIKKLLNEPQKSVDLINFVDVDKTKPCWIRDIQINNETGAIEGELITNITNTTQDVPSIVPVVQTQRRPILECGNNQLCFANEINSQYIGAI